MNSLTLRDKPANATYVAKAIIDPDGNVQMTPRADEEISWGERVEVAWYDGYIKVTVPGSTPATISQAYMTGKNQDVIVEIRRAVATEVVFEVAGEGTVTVSAAEARVLSEKLIGFSFGHGEGDVALLEANGHDRAWLKGAIPLAHAILFALAGMGGAIPLDPTDPEADAAFAVYSLPGPSSWDATSGASRLRGAIERSRGA